MSDLFDKTTQALGQSANLRLLRQNVVSGNIANAETPGYKAKKLDFEDSLKRALELEGFGKMSATHENHFPISRGRVGRVQPEIYDNPDVNMTNDKNTVDLEKEMASLAENNLNYNAAIELIKKKLGALKYVVSEGGR